MTLHWQVLEYEEKQRSSDWFWAVGIIAASVAVTSIIFNNILFAILILLGVFTLILFTFKKPEMMDIEMNDRGIRLGKTLYLFSDLESFGIEEMNPDKPLAIVKSKKAFMHNLVIPLENDSVEEVRGMLAEKLEEKQHMEPLSHKLLDFLGF